MSLDQALQHLKIDGWYVMEGVIPESEVDAVRQSVERSTLVHCNPNAPDGIGHVPGFIRYDQSIAPYLADRRMLALVEALVRTPCAGILYHRHNQLSGKRARRVARGLAL